MASPDWRAGLPTPAYVYDLDELRRAHRSLRHALPAGTELFYSIKANPHPLIVAALGEAGASAEICSPGELAVALDAGFDPARLLYTGPGKRDQDVADALKAGVGLFSADSPHGLDQVRGLADDLGATARVLLRVNDTTPVPGTGLAMTGVASQFGADADWILGQPHRFRGPRLAGLHLYMGTNTVDEDVLVAQLTQSARTARKLADACGFDLELLDLGGGFGAPSARAGELPEYPNLAERIAGLLDEIFPDWRIGRPRIAFESGRYLTATCGTLLTRVLDVKQSRDQRVLVLESGINHLGGMSGLRRLPPVVPTLELLAQREEPGGRAIVAGPLCTPLDTWGIGVTAPPARIGDLIAVPNVGAYGLSASLLAFLGHPAPTEIVVAGQRILHTSRLVSQRSEKPWTPDSPPCSEES